MTAFLRVFLYACTGAVTIGLVPAAIMTARRGNRALALSVFAFAAFCIWALVTAAGDLS